MSNDKAAASYHGSTCRWGGTRTGACWNVGACGCALPMRPAPTKTRLSLWDRIVLVIMQAPVRIGRRR